MDTTSTAVDSPVRGYKLNYATNTICLNKKFAKAAMTDFNSAEAKILREIKDAFPMFSVIVKAGKEIKTARPTKRLTYKNMKEYIGICADADVLLAAFETTIKASKAQKSPYKYVRDWFKEQFPNFRDSKVFLVPTNTTNPKVVELPAESKKCGLPTDDESDKLPAAV